MIIGLSQIGLPVFMDHVHQKIRRIRPQEFFQISLIRKAHNADSIPGRRGEPCVRPIVPCVRPDPFPAPMINHTITRIVNFAVAVIMNECRGGPTRANTRFAPTD